MCLTGAAAATRRLHLAPATFIQFLVLLLPPQEAMVAGKTGESKGDVLLDAQQFIGPHIRLKKLKARAQLGHPLSFNYADYLKTRYDKHPRVLKQIEKIPAASVRSGHLVSENLTGILAGTTQPLSLATLDPGKLRKKRCWHRPAAACDT